MTVSIWTDGLAFLAVGEFNRLMRSQLGYAAMALVLIGGFLWWASGLNDGPEITGPAEAQVRVEEVPSPATEEPVDVWALPEGFRQLLERDAILPIYNPTFTSAAEAEWPDDALVVGVEIGGEARAYPVGPLNRREMVIDTIGGTPVLVTW